MDALNPLKIKPGYDEMEVVQVCKKQGPAYTSVKM